jgi:Spy/CpxP family protein refolding chaperone
MKSTLKTILIILATALLAVAVAAQDDPTSDKKIADRPNPPVRILAELGLTREQIQQIRRINAERKPLITDAQLKLREANRELDLAIYSETASEDDIKLKMKDVQSAQAEVIKVRTLTEYLIRKVLTPEQLDKFRQLRERMMQRRNQPNDTRRNLPVRQRPQADRDNN